MKTFIATLLLIPCVLWASESNVDDRIFIAGYETSNKQMTPLSKDYQEIYQSKQHLAINSLSNKENTNQLQTLLRTFQSAINDLCISQIELELAFNASTKIWIVAHGEMASSVKIVLMNPNKNCSSSK